MPSYQRFFLKEGLVLSALCVYLLTAIGPLALLRSLSLRLAFGPAAAWAQGAPTVPVDFVPGLNLFSFPVAIPSSSDSCFELLSTLGGPVSVESISRFNTTTQLFEVCAYSGSTAAGENFSIRDGEGYQVRMKADNTVVFGGTAICPTVTLNKGTNIIGVPSPPAGLSCFDLLTTLGAEKIATSQGYNKSTGAFEACTFAAGNAPAGDDFPLTSGEAYLISMRQDVNGFDPNDTTSCEGSPIGNVPPVFTSIGNQTVVLGTSLRLTLNASDRNCSVATADCDPGDIDVDRLTFSVTPVPLPPNMEFQPTSGQLTFRPNATQAGQSFALTFRVHDGALTDEETIQITVQGPPPNGVTALTGRLLDTNAFVQGQEVPVVGATVSLLGTGLSTLSDATGHFLLSGTPAGVQILDINTVTANMAPDGSSYTGFREQITLDEGVTNVVERPVFMPRLASESLTTVNPNVTTVVRNPTLDVTITVPPHTAKNPDGTDFTGQLSISEVPAGIAPAALPRELQFGLLITIQPVGVTFATPVPISLPNIDGLPPGAEINIWSLDAGTGAFVVVGTGRVSADGTMIDTVAGGIRAADWHGGLPPAPPPPPSTPGDGENPGNESPNNCTPCGTGSETHMHNGNLVIDHTLAGYRSFGQTRAPRLVYNSLHADPQLVLSSNLAMSQDRIIPRDCSELGIYNQCRMTGAVESNWLAQCQEDAARICAGTFSVEFNVAGTIQEPIFFDPQLTTTIPAKTVRAAVQVDASTLPTGLYPVNVEVRSYLLRSSIASTFDKSLLVNNQRNSPLGAGWTIDGLSRLHVQDDGNVVLTDGDGTTMLFRLAQRTAADIGQSGEQDRFRFVANANTRITIRMNRLPNQPDGTGSLDPQVELRDSRGTLLARDDDSGTVDNSTTVNPGGPGGNALIASFLLPATDTYLIIAKGTDGSRGPYELLVSPDSLQLNPEGNPGSMVVQTAAVSPPGDFSTLQLNADGTFTRRLKEGTQIHFNAQGLQTSIVDRNENATAYAYDAAGRLTRITDPKGRHTTLSYANGLLSSLIDPTSRVTSFAHDSAGDLIRITDPDGSDREFTYDARHRLVSQTSKRNLVTTYEYNFAGRNIKAMRPDASAVTVQPKETVGVVDPASGLGAPSNPAPTIEVNLTVLEATLVDGNGNLRRFATDRFGATTRLISGGQTTLIARTSNSDPGETTRPNGAQMQWVYDVRGNILSFRPSQDAQPTLFTYEPVFNLPTSIKDPNGNTSTITYDAKGNPIAILNPQGIHTVLRYQDTNCPGLPTNVIAAEGLPEEATSTFVYDASTCNLVRTVDPLGQGTEFAYDTAGNPVRVTDAELRTTRLAYDTLNHVTKIVDANNAEPSPLCGTSGATCFQYDVAGNLAALVDARNSETQFSYDSRDRLSTRVDPLGRSETFAYDGNGNLRFVMDRKGQTIEFRYDSLDRLIKKLLLPGTPQEAATTYTYDTVDNLRSVADSDSSFSMSYDLRDRLTSVSTGSANQPTTTLSYTYDQNGNRLRLTDATGQTNYAYDLLNQPTQITNPASQIVNFVYDALNRRIQTTLPNGTTANSVYDVASQLTGLTHKLGMAPFSEFAYAYDGVGNRTTLTTNRSSVSVNMNLNYTYDALNQLIQATRPLPAQPDETFTYDPVGNRLRRDGQSVDATFDAGNRLLEDAQFCYVYDNNGNLVSTRTKIASACAGDLTTYSYDVENQLIRIDLPGSQIAEYRYDGLGRRIEKKVDGVITRYVYDNGDILLEFDGSNTRVARYTHGTGIDEPLVMERGGQSFFYHADGLGSVTELTDTASNRVQVYVYDSFGNITQQAGMIINPYTFTGREVDTESGLYYYRARYYDPRRGRFLSEDLIRFAGESANLYPYVANNPEKFRDPLGLKACEVDKFFRRSGDKVKEEIEKEYEKIKKNPIKEGAEFLKSAQEDRAFGKGLPKTDFQVPVSDNASIGYGKDGTIKFNYKRVQ